MKCRLCCTLCGKSVSSLFIPTTTEFGDDLIVRGIIICPECLETKIEIKNAPRIYPHTVKE